MYTLNCNYYRAEWPTLEDLISDVLNKGVDPNLEVLRDGKPTGELLIDLIQF
jgi:hypothetical protein